MVKSCTRKFSLKKNALFIHHLFFQRLSETKLKSLFGELKLHDKEEITWKHLRAEGKDKDGMKEAELRKKLMNIMSMYNLLDQSEHVDDPNKTRPFKPLNEASDKHINKSLFKDKKLNKLWQKAETAGFTPEELLALREEFDHHEDKIEQYYALLHDVKGNPDDPEESKCLQKNFSKYTFTFVTYSFIKMEGMFSTYHFNIACNFMDMEPYN